MYVEYMQGYVKGYDRLSIKESLISPMTACWSRPWSSTTLDQYDALKLASIMPRTECAFNHADLCCGCVEPGECTPIIHDQPSPDNIRATVYSTSLGCENR